MSKPLSLPTVLQSAGIVLVAVGCASVGVAEARSVRAGTMISNTAIATFGDAGASVTIRSNSVAIRVDELVDVTVTMAIAGPVAATGGAAGTPLGFTIANIGNGPEAFVLKPVGDLGNDDFDPGIVTLAIDGNGDGVYEPGVDPTVPTGAATPLLDPEGRVTVFVLAAIPGGTVDATRGNLRLVATAATGSGAAGTVFSGSGDQGGDAIIGATTGQAQADATLIATRAAVAIVKSATVLDPFGGARAVPGAIITYRLAATVSGSGTATGVHILDAIPDGSSYQPGSLALDGTVLSDASDADSGAASATGIDVVLGDQATGSTHTIQFNVKIN